MIYNQQSVISNQQIKVSFILPVYNVEKYLASAVESVLRQDIEKEIILVDDGSADGSLEIALSYACRYPFVSVISGVNRGVSAARNRGLALARGEFVLFLDPDDELTAEADIDKMYFLAKQYNTDAVKGQYVRSSEDSPGKLFRIPPSCKGVEGDTVWVTTMNGFFCQTVVGNWLKQIACFLLRREFLLENRLFFDENQSYAEDGLFYVNLYCSNGSIMEIADTVLHYQQRFDGVMMQGVTAKRIEDHFRATEIIRIKAGQCREPVLKECLERVLAIYYFILDGEINTSKNLDLKERFKSLITPQMREFYLMHRVSNRPMQLV